MAANVAAVAAFIHQIADAPGDLPEATDLYCAVRVTDSSDPMESDVYVWANPIQLVNSVSHVVVDDTSYSCPTQIQTGRTDDRSRRGTPAPTSTW